MGKNVKGRDWYDKEWYIRKGIKLNLNHFVIRARDSGYWHKEEMAKAEFRALLSQKIDMVKMDYVISDIRRFIRDPKVLEIWSAQYFHDIVDKLQIGR